MVLTDQERNREEIIELRKDVVALGAELAANNARLNGKFTKDLNESFTRIKTVDTKVSTEILRRKWQERKQGAISGATVAVILNVMWWVIQHLAK